jgi:hypothetical protein
VEKGLNVRSKKNIDVDNDAEMNSAIEKLLDAAASCVATFDLIWPGTLRRLDDRIRRSKGSHFEQLTDSNQGK